jgi:hypothetical protein
MRIILSGLEYLCHSPSLFELVTSPGVEPARIGYTGQGRWQIGSADRYGCRVFKSRQEAAQLIRDAFDRASEREEAL